MGDLYSHRWEIELGYREIKQTMQRSRLTLRSKKPELVEQELWGVLLAYNLVRYQMIKMAEHLKGYWPNQLSFSESCGMVMRMLITLQGASPGRIPELMRDLASMGQLVKLPTRRERAFPRVVKGEALEIPHGPEKEPVSCLTDWHYRTKMPISFQHQLLNYLVANENTELFCPS